jgi:hypothetical protein
MHEAKRRGHPIDHLFDCGECKSMFGRETRQAMGCGWEDKSPRVPSVPWSPSCLQDNHDWRCLGKTQSEPSVCPGYSISLPETLEIVRAHAHWTTGGGLRDFTADPTEALKLGVEMLSGACSECQHWSLDNPKVKP